MNAQQLKNAILQDLYSAKDGWNIEELKEVVADSCPISYGIVQQGNHVDGGVPVVRPVDLHTKYVGKVNLKCTSKDISDSYKRTVLNGNEVLLCVRGTTGIVALATGELKGCNVNRGIVPLYFGDDVDKLFIYYQLQAPFVQEAIEENTMGSALKQINIKDLRTLKLLVPPLEEQHRIVAKIEQLLPKVEEYGKAQDALNKLNAELPDRLKKSILQEAIEGRLVPQDPNDERASVLLAKIRKEKEQLVKAGKLKKKDLIETPISEDEIPFAIPDSWEWCRVKTILNVYSARRVHEKDWRTSGIPFYRAREIGKLADYGFVNNDLFIDKSLYDEFSKSGVPTAGDLMVTAVGTLGKTYIVKEGEIFYYKDGSVLCFNNRFNMDAKFLKYYIESPAFIEQYANESQGTTVATLTMVRVNEYLIPLPPLAEQHRIVEKLEQLLGKIDKLKK
jgi:type I restriction enzyme S subunit